MRIDGSVNALLKEKQMVYRIPSPTKDVRKPMKIYSLYKKVNSKTYIKVSDVGYTNPDIALYVFGRRMLWDNTLRIREQV